MNCLRQSLNLQLTCLSYCSNSSECFYRAFELSCSIPVNTALHSSIAYKMSVTFVFAVLRFVIVSTVANYTMTSISILLTMYSEASKACEAGP